LSAALDAITKDSALKKADVVLVTDGECDVSDDFAESWARAKVEHQFTCERC